MRQIGILGGGQLGMLLTQSLQRLGSSVIIYDPDPKAPACNQVSVSFNSPWTDVGALNQFASRCHAITYEFENVESDVLFSLDKQNRIVPDLRVLKTTQDRILEKQFLKESGLPHARFTVVENHEQLISYAKHFGYPFILKTARGGYDGKGQHLINSPCDLKTLMNSPGNIWKEHFAGVLEEVIDLTAEVSCIVAGSPRSGNVVFPVFENIHRDHILDLTVYPARIPTRVQEKLQEIAVTASEILRVHGLLTVEFFLSRSPSPASASVECDGWHIFINEFAPRPHNSGHVTKNACTTSQFEALARILLDIPLSKPQIIAPGFFCMANLLGNVWLSQGSDHLDLSTLINHPLVIDIVLYGKEEARMKRKMGHVVTYAPTPEEAMLAARAFRQSLYRNERAKD